MIEITVLNYLERNLEVPVYMEYPENPPGSLVLLHKAGSGRENRIDRARFIAESYAATLLDASILNNRVKNALDNLPELPDISASELVTDYPVPDEKNKRRRYQAVYNITFFE